MIKGPPVMAHIELRLGRFLAGLALLLLLAFATTALSPSYAVAQQAAPSATAPAQTEKQPPKALFPRPSSKAEVPQPPSGPLAGLYMWIAEKQQAFTRTMAGALRDIRGENALYASLLLIMVSFAYGVLHAAGPGHGKAIVSSYMLADNQTVRRGIWLAIMSSLVQALSAITLFGIVVLLARGARTEIVSTEAFLERLSWAIVAAFGAWLIVRQVRALWTGRSAHAAAGHHHVHGLACDHGHDHAHDHKHAHAAADLHGDHHHQSHAHHDHADHAHAHAHTDGDVCETCGHAHIPTAEAVQGEWSWKRALTLALAVGIRPCTGAIGVLFVANGLGLMWAGIASTFAMAIGTAITVSTLAVLAVSSRDLATRIAGGDGSPWAFRAQTAIGLAGAVLVFGLGTTFFLYSLRTPTPF